MAADTRDKPHGTRTDARDALIQAAIELFGLHGFDAVSVRMLSEHAGTNIAATKYHFGGKDQLYRAAMLHVAEQMRPRIDMARAAFQQGRELAADDPVLQARLVALLVNGIVETFLRNPEMRRIVPLVLREFSQPSQHFDEFYEALPCRLHELFTGVVAMVDRLPENDPRLILRAHALIGQIMVFNLARQILFRRMGWSDYGDAEIRAVAAEVTRLMLRALNLPEAP